MIYAENLSKWFDDFLAVDHIQLDVPTGSVMVLLGPNGAGKTTTVRMLTSILTPSSGRAMVAGYDVVTQAQQVRTAVGVLTEHHGLYGRMNAMEYLDFFGELYGLPSGVRRKRALDLLEQFGLTFALRKRLGEYSKGMRQKLALVRALLNDPPVLLLDEPTSAMDPESARMVRDAIHGLRSSERTILLCTHNLTEAEELADCIAIIRRGRIIFNDTPLNMKRQMLGPAEYEVRLARPLNGWSGSLPPEVELVERGEDWLRFRIETPEVHNPQLLRQLVNDRLEIVHFQEIPRSLEHAYLEAVSRYQEEQHA